MCDVVHMLTPGVPFRRCAQWPVVLAGDLNQARRRDCPAEEWAVVEDALRRFGAPADDGVSGALEAAGLACCWDAASSDRNFARHPPATHWTGTVVDHVYARAGAGAGRGAAVVGAYVYASAVSDHMPVVVDLKVGRGVE